MKTKTAAVALLLIMTSCSLFQKDSFEGAWIFELSGGIEESITIDVTETFEIDSEQIIQFQNRDYNVRFKGKISEDGILNADIIVGSDRMGSIEGNMTFTSGFGKWGAQVIAGEWKAYKK
jgi:hypothetical protein